jgi:hypothetical protein
MAKRNKLQGDIRWFRAYRGIASLPNTLEDAALAEAIAQEVGWEFYWRRLTAGDRDFDREYGSLAGADRKRVDKGKLALMELLVRVDGDERITGPYWIENAADMRMSEADFAVEIAWREGMIT